MRTAVSTVSTEQPLLLGKECIGLVDGRYLCGKCVEMVEMVEMVEIGDGVFSALTVIFGPVVPLVYQ